MPDRVPDRDGDLQRILRNGATLIATRVLTKIATTLLTIYVARRLGTEEFGVFSSLLASLALISLIGEFGLTPPLVRRIARHDGPPGDRVGVVVALKIPLGVLAFLGVLLAASLMGISYPTACIFGASLFFEVMVLSVVRAFEGMESMQYIAVITVIERVLLCGIGFVVLAAGYGLSVLGLAYLASNVSSFLLGLSLFSKRFSPVRLRVSLEEWGALLREAVPFLAAGVLSVLYSRADLFALTIFRSKSEVGWYNAAMRVIEALMFIPMAIVAALFPVLTRHYHGSLDQFRRSYRLSFMIIGAAGVLSSTLIVVFAGTIIGVLYPTSFADAVGPLKILGGMLVFFFLNFLLGNALIAAGREQRSTLTLAVGMVANVLLNVLLIPRFGVTGAATARLAAEFISFAVQAYFVREVLRGGARPVNVVGSPTSLSASHASSVYED